MNRGDLQRLSRIRAQEAKALLDSGHFGGSYYLMGYSVECAIKAAIAKRTQRHDFPDRQLAIDSFKHDLSSLLQTARLRTALDAAMAVSQPLRENWAVVKDWTETVRYESATAESTARDFYSACTARTNGILTWLKHYW
jgi:HEPN domain